MLLKAKTCLHEKQGTHKDLPTQHSLKEHSTVKLCGVVEMAIRLCLHFVHTKIYYCSFKIKTRFRMSAERSVLLPQKCLNCISIHIIEPAMNRANLQMLS